MLVKLKSDQILSIAKTAQSAYFSDTISQLDLNQSDLKKIEYNHLKNSLINIKNVNPDARFAYIYTQREGKIYMVADSEALVTPDYSPPGQEYPEADYQTFQPFADGQARITIPTPDRWGTWVSALVPIKNSSNEVIAVFGMDYPALDWKNAVLSHTIRFIIVLLILYLPWLFFYQKTVSSLKSTKTK